MADAFMKADVELAAAIPEIWSAAFYPTLLEKLPFASSVAMDYQGEIANLGDTVNITSFPQFDEAEEILESQAVEAEATTLTNIQLLINKQLAKDFIITKKADIQSLEVMNALRDLALHSILKKMQKIIIAAIVPSTSPDHTIAFGFINQIATHVTDIGSEKLSYVYFVCHTPIPKGGLIMFYCL